MLNYFLKLINCNKRRTTQGGGVAAPVGGQIFSEVLPYLEVSKGNPDEVEEKEEVTVPDVKGLSVEDAIKTLKYNGFEVKISEEESIDKKNTYVNSQMPIGGIKAYKGSCVYINY